jgi:hypothetical protein
MRGAPTAPHHHLEPQLDAPRVGLGETKTSDGVVSRETGSCICQQAAGGESRQGREQEQELSGAGHVAETVYQIRLRGTNNAKKPYCNYYRSCLHVTVAAISYPFLRARRVLYWYTRRHSRAFDLSQFKSQMDFVQ